MYRERRLFASLPRARRPTKKVREPVANPNSRGLEPIGVLLAAALRLAASVGLTVELLIEALGVEGIERGGHAEQSQGDQNG